MGPFFLVWAAFLEVEKTWNLEKNENTMKTPSSRPKKSVHYENAYFFQVGPPSFLDCFLPFAGR